MSEILGTNSNFNHSTETKENKKEELESIINWFMVDKTWFVNFWDVARKILNQQSQYASRYVDWKIDWYPNLGEWLKFKSNIDVSLKYIQLWTHQNNDIIYS